MCTALPLLCSVQNYNWGKRGALSSVFRLAQVANPSLPEDREYAELWMGTHPNAPSKAVVSTANGPATMLLSDLIKANPSQWLGSDVLREFGSSQPDLPFLFKVLSVEKALSIQAHPDKSLAERLFAAKPDLYKDGNHKPEIALPITDFEALCGFRPREEIAQFAREIPEFAAVISFSSVSSEPFDIRTHFSSLMTCTAAVVRENLDGLVGKIRRGLYNPLSRESQWVLRLCEQFPHDSGIFCVYFLNLVKVAPGHFIFCAPNEPHAYLSGDCVECMACSDNVVRAGLTPKPKDVDTLLDMLTYKDDLCEKLVNKGAALADGVVFYDPPVKDFKVYAITCAPASERRVDLATGPAIVLSMTEAGNAPLLEVSHEKEPTQSFEVPFGSVWFVKAGASLRFFGGSGSVFVATC